MNLKLIVTASFLAFFLVSCGIIKYSINGVAPYYLFLADRTNNRVLIWKKAPTMNQPAPDMVLGQDDFTSSSTSISQSSMDDPEGIATDNIHLAIVNDNSHRILIWNSMPTINNQPADLVLGQTNFTSSGRNSGAGASNAVTCGRGLDFPQTVTFAGEKVLVTDLTNNRVLIWNTFPTVNGQAADVVVGQPSMCTEAANSPSAATGVSQPYGLGTDGTRMCILDNQNNRILLYNSIPTVNGQQPDIVLGQPDFTSVVANNTPGAVGTVSSQSISNPCCDCRYINGKFYVTDMGNHRILGWNAVPTRNQQPADFVIGQPDLITGTANTNGISARSLSFPDLLAFDGLRFFVTDNGNNRLLVWNGLPDTTNKAADFVVGQSSMSQNSINAAVGYVNPLGMNNIAAPATNGSYLGVSRPEGF